MRMAGASTTRAPSARRRAARPLACARARVTATLTPASGPRPQPRELVVQRGDRADDRHRRRVGVLLAERRHGRQQHALVGQGPALDDGRRLARVAAVGHELLGDARQLAHAHVEDERAGEGGQRRPVDGGLRLRRVLVPGHEGHRAGHPALGDRDPGVARRGHAGGHAGHDLVVAAGGAQRLRLLAAAPEDERVAALQAHDRAPGAGVLDEQRASSRAGAPARRRRPCRRRRPRRRAARRPAPRGGIRRSWRMTSALAMSSMARAVSRPGSPGPAPTR